MDPIRAIKSGLAKTRANLRLGELFRRTEKPADIFLAELEKTLYEGDLGVEVTEILLDAVRKRAKSGASIGELKTSLQEQMIKIFPPDRSQDGIPGPEVILLVGVNGCGKTTVAGKLAYRFAQEGKRVALAAADTFRAAAIEQLKLWGERAGARVIHQNPGADPAAVAFDALQSAIARNEDALIIDTAGRLTSKSNLMNELEKMVRVLKKLSPDAPHRVWLVLDAIIGQNAMEQAEIFGEKAGVTGLILTKLDGTARGGSALAVAHTFNLPIEYLGVGEKIDQLLPFEPELFVNELLSADD